MSRRFTPRSYALILAVVVVAALLVIAVVPALRSGVERATGRPEAGGARSVILINGDGMSAAHREAARLAEKGPDGRLAMDSLPVSGLQTTTPDDPDSAITDSAAAASAWATGHKTYNGAISMDVDKRSLPTIGRQAKAAGKATGLVTTTRVTDASPAAFFANVDDRKSQDEIARQYLKVSTPDVILGGGADKWGDLLDVARQEGYQYVSTPGELRDAKPTKLLGLFAETQMFKAKPEGQGDTYSPAVSLETMTRKALDVVSRDKDGFFLFVEEEGVDEFSHANNATGMLRAMKALDATVAVARAYVADHPETLLIVTGDHDCGGLTVEPADDEDESGSGPSAEDGPFTVHGTDRRFYLDWTTTGHTGAPTPVSAIGVNSDRLEGTYSNTHLHEVMLATLLTS
jgi:alkaline phosphatase